jgi:hypothetical protein
MYYPFFRGKQYELITIREKAKLLKDAGFIPIIEPVKESLNGLARTLSEIEKVKGQAIVIVNPAFGYHADDATPVQSLLDNQFNSFEGLSAGVLLPADMAVADVKAICESQKGRKTTLVHCGFADGRSLAETTAHCSNVDRHVFFEEDCGKLYRKHFQKATRVLLRDGFQRRANRDHPLVESFSDLHVTFTDEGMNGFGDFLVVGDDFFETGGPAYTVAIHLTFIDREKDEAMFIRHFKSDRTDTPTDPGGKFAEALAKLVKEVERTGSPIERTSAVEEFLEFHRQRHFPGLGYVKKLSMQHHLETLSNFFPRS